MDEQNQHSSEHILFDSEIDTSAIDTSAIDTSSFLIHPCTTPPMHQEVSMHLPCDDEDDMQSQSIVNADDQSFMINLPNETQLRITDSIVNLIQSRVFQDLRKAFNAKIENYFEGLFISQLEAMVDTKISEIAANMSSQTNRNTSTMHNTTRHNISNSEEGLSNVEKLLEDRIDPKMNKNDTKIEELERAIGKINNEIKAIQTNHKTFVEQTDNNLAKQMQNKEDSMQRISCIEDANAKLALAQDAQEQYGRLDILKIKGIPTPNPNICEDTTDVVVDFLDRYLNLNVSEYDISVSHRMYIHAEKMKEGPRYIPSIYVKFVNRSLVHKILSRRHLLKKANKVTGLNLSIEENLTLKRRKIMERVEKELPHYKHKWVKNGNIFVRKDRHSRPVKVIDEKVLDLLLSQEALPYENCQKDRNSAHCTSVSLPEATRQGNTSIQVQSHSNSYATIVQSTPISIPPFPFRHTIHPIAINSMYKSKSKTPINLNSSV